jgi:transcriptional regulator with XRE-family HTH domain
MSAVQPIGHRLREWRQRRRWTQLDLACEAEISSKHLSFLETGRSKPSREMLLHLAELLEVPLRERNEWLVAAGFAPVFTEHALDAPELQMGRRAIEQVLRGHEPFPALAIDRHWNMITANRIVPHLLAGITPSLLEPPVNVLRLSLHPEGLAPRIANFHQWRTHLLNRLRRQIDLSADADLAKLHDELEGYPTPPATRSAREEPTHIVVPLRLEIGGATLSFISTTTVFGTPVDITLSELAIESFFPTDAETASTLNQLAAIGS